MKTAEQILGEVMGSIKGDPDLGHLYGYAYDYIDEAKSTAIIQEALEARHRKTWALAMECAAKCAKSHEGSYKYMDDKAQRYMGDVVSAIKLLRCPLIEATKDK